MNAMFRFNQYLCDRTRRSVCLSNDRPVGLVVGTSGTGKSTLALEFARQFLKPSQRVFYFSGCSEDLGLPPSCLLEEHLDELSRNENFTMLHQQQSHHLLDIEFTDKDLIIFDEVISDLNLLAKLLPRIKKNETKILLVAQSISDVEDVLISASQVAFKLFSKLSTSALTTYFNDHDLDDALKINKRLNISNEGACFLLLNQVSSNTLEPSQYDFLCRSNQVFHQNKQLAA